MQILVPLDGSSLADGILRHVRRLTLNRSASIRLLRVLTPGSDEEDKAQARAHLLNAMEELGPVDGAVTTEVVSGFDPAHEILLKVEAADSSGETPFDLIAMATHGRSGIARLVRGSVAERVLRNAEIPVYLANRKGLSGNVEAHYKRVMIPLDGSRYSASIMSLVLPIVVESPDAEVVLVHVSVPGKESQHPVPEVAKRRAHETAETALREVSSSLEAAGVRVRVLGFYGDPADKLLDAIVREEVDLLAMTSHGRDGLSRWRFGSVAEKVLRQARCPLLVKTAGKGTR